MARVRQVEMYNHRSARLSIIDDGASGGIVRVFLRGEIMHRSLRNYTPNGLAVLIEEAEA